MVYSVAVTSLTRVHEMVRDVGVDESNDADNASISHEYHNVGRGIWPRPRNTLSKPSNSQTKPLM